MLGLLLHQKSPKYKYPFNLTRISSFFKMFFAVVQAVTWYVLCSIRYWKFCNILVISNRLACVK